ncbi:PEP-CTERM sorting domain-containing protein [Nitrosomonas nitrosa]
MTNPINSVPEPPLIGLLAIGLLGMGIYRRKTAQ